MLATSASDRYFHETIPWRTRQLHVEAAKRAARLFRITAELVLAESRRFSTRSEPGEMPSE